MSKLNELIQEYCPDGVELYKFDDVCQFIRGITYNKSQEAKAASNTDVAVFRANNITLNSNTLNYDDVKMVVGAVKVKDTQWLRKGDILMCAGSGSKDHIGKVAFIENDMKYTFGGFMGVVRCDDTILPRYMFHILTSGYFSKHLESAINSATINNINGQVMSSFEFPVPPLPVQSEIVRILDNFTNLTAELTAELIARKKQYEYYRDTLLTHDGTIEKKNIGEITRVFSASRVHKEDWTASGVPFFRSSDVISYFNGVENSRGKAFISHELYEKLSAKSGKIRKDDVLVTGGGTIGIPYVMPNDDPLYVKDADLICIQKTDCLNSRFLYHYFLSTPFRDYLSSITHDATIAHYTISQVMNTPIPLPPLDVQERLVRVLDNFDAICSDLKIGLPAEIEARQKQYEYYRDKLLSFKEHKNELSD